MSGALSNATEHPRDEVGLMRSLGEHRAALSALYDRLDGTGVPVSPGRVSEWRERIHARESAIETIEQRLAATDRFAGLFSQPAGIQRVQACLHAGEVLVEYFLEGTLLSAFVLRSGGVEVRRGMAAMDDVTSTLAELSFQVARAIARGLPGGDAGDRLTRDARGVLARLHGLLMAPIATCVAGAERIIVVPFGPLFAVPFSALVGPDGREVVEICETSVVPSASVFEHLRVRSRSASPEGRFGHGALVMGVSDVAAPDANAEAAQVAVVVPEARLFVGAGATREVFVREAPGSTLVHLATHARFLANDPSASGIRLADGWLTTHDLAGLRLNGATVVLSACDTGRTTVGAGEEILGLARALFLAGASTLVMSLWPVHDESTRHLMACLHSARYVQGANWPLAARVSVPCATALRSAQRTVRLQRAHPAAWAPFFCIGIP